MNQETPGSSDASFERSTSLAAGPGGLDSWDPLMKGI